MSPTANFNLPNRNFTSHGQVRGVTSMVQGEQWPPPAFRWFKKKEAVLMRLTSAVGTFVQSVGTVSPAIWSIRSSEQAAACVALQSSIARSRDPMH